MDASLIAGRGDAIHELRDLVARHSLHDQSAEAGGRDRAAPPAAWDASDDDYTRGSDSDGDARRFVRQLVAPPPPRPARRGGRAMQASQRHGAAMAMAQAERGNGRRVDRDYDDAPGADPVDGVAGGVAGLALDDRPPLCDSPEYARVQQELGDGGGPGACFCCRLVRDGERVAPVCRDGMRKLMEAVDLCVGADPVRLSLDLAEVYERLVRRPANAARREGETECPEWPAASIYEHFYTPCHGRLDAAASVRRRVRYLEQACCDMERYGVYTEVRAADGSVRRVPDAQRLRELRATYRDLDRLYMTNPSKLLFAGSNASALQHSSALPPRPMYGSLPAVRPR